MLLSGYADETIGVRRSRTQFVGCEQTTPGVDLGQAPNLVRVLSRWYGTGVPIDVEGVV